MVSFATISLLDLDPDERNPVSSVLVLLTVPVLSLLSVPVLSFVRPLNPIPGGGPETCVS